MKPNLEKDGQADNESCSESPNTNPVTIVKRNGVDIQVWHPFKDVTEPEREKGEILKVFQKQVN